MHKASFHATYFFGEWSMVNGEWAREVVKRETANVKWLVNLEINN